MDADDRATGAGAAQRPLQSGVDATVALLARALHLDRAALIVRAPDGSGARPLAVHGDVASGDWGEERLDESRWSAVLPIGDGGVPALLLLGRRDRAPLSEQDRALATSVVTAAASGAAAADPAAAPPARDRLAHADRLAAIGTLAAGVAHEIRNPLVSVRTFIQLLPERLDDEEFRTGFRDLALAEIDRICGLINDLLAFSRPQPEARERVDPGVLVAQIVRLLDAEARKGDVRLSCEAHEATPAVVANEAQLKQVLMNLVLNAIQATPPHGLVEVTVRPERHRGAPWCLVEVADTGSGIDLADAGRIFDPFYTTKDLGSGLGLFIARRLVEEHGGTITIAPRPGAGSLFTVRLPAAHERAHG